MMKVVTLGAGAVGGAILVYVSRNYWGQDFLGLGIVGLIGLGFVTGLRELWGHWSALRIYRVELEQLGSVAGTLGDDRDERPDFSGVSAGLRHVLEGRLCGQSLTLPVPAGTSYLLGLLVMLGLLGTFFGMVETLQGARAVLAGSNEIVTMREGLVAPVMGLSRAFGTSVAGVSCSALLGLVAVFASRDRLILKHTISRLLTTSLYRWSVTGKQESTLTALTAQLAEIPVAMGDFGRLTASMGTLTERMAENQASLVDRMMSSQQELTSRVANSHEELTSRLIEEQGQFADRVVTSQESLATEAGSMLKLVTGRVADAMDEGTRKWVEHSTAELKPLLVEALRSVAATTQTHFEGWGAALEAHGERRLQEQERWHETFKGVIEELAHSLSVEERARLAALNGELNELIEHFKVGLLGLGEENRECLGRFETTVGRFEVSMESHLSQVRIEHEGMGARLVELGAEFTRQQEEMGAGFGGMVRGLGEQLASNLGDIESLHLENLEKSLGAVESLDGVVRQQLEQLGAGLGESLQGVVESAERAPKVAAEVLTSLQGRVEEQIVRENSLVAERTDLMAGLGDVVSHLRDAADSHQAVIRSVTESAKAELAEVGQSTRQELEATRTDIAEAAAMIGAGGHEMAALTEMFSASVGEYRTSNERLLEGLDKIEESLGRAGERSDKQLNLYVSQAREIIDHSMLSQKEVFDELKLLRISKVPMEDNV